MNDTRIVYLGPEGSYSNEAAEQARAMVASYLQNRANITVAPNSILLKPCDEVDGIEGSILLGDGTTFAVVPICNSRIGDTYGFLPFYSYNFVGSQKVDIRLILCNSSGNRDSIKRIVTKDEAFRQVKSELNQ